MTLKVLHIQLFPILSGAPKVCLDELKFLRSQSIACYLICKEDGDFPQQAQKLGVHTLFFPFLVRDISPIKDIQALFCLYRLIKKIQPVVVHTHSTKPGILGRIAAKFAGIPIIVHTVHGFPHAKTKLQKYLYPVYEKIAGYFCMALITLNSTDETFAKEALSIPQHKVFVIPNGVDIQCYKPCHQSQREKLRKTLLKVEHDAIVVGMIARLETQKNPICFVQTGIQVLNERQTQTAIYFVIVGDGELRSEIEDLIVTSKFSKKIFLLGWRNDIVDLLNTFDVFFSSSDWEGMPLAILEAMSCELPIVCADIDAHRTLVQNGQNGYLFEPSHVQSAKQYLQKLIDDALLRKSMGNHNRQKIVQDYCLSNRLQRIQNLYQYLTNSAKLK